MTEDVIKDTYTLEFINLPELERYTESEMEMIAKYFCYNISNGNFSNIQFSFDGIKENARVILKGDASQVLKFVNEYYSKFRK